MASRKLNVLVYSGTGTTSESVRHCLLTLRRLLYPNYAVIAVTESALLKEPWQASCALLVIPGGADMGYSRVLNGAGNRRIAHYVRTGGRYLGLCAGGYYGSGRCEFEIGNKPLEVIGRRELGLFRGTCRGGAYPGFAYHSEAGARAVPLTIHRQAFSVGTANDELPDSAYSYYNGGGVFVDAKTADNVQILASYPNDIVVDGGKGRAAVIYCTAGEGAAILTGPHPEFEPANMVERPDQPGYQDLLRALRKDDESQARVRFLKACLAKLGLELGPADANAVPPRLSAMHVMSLYPDEVQELVYAWDEMASKRGNASIIRGEKDTFRVLQPDSGAGAWPAQASITSSSTMATANEGHHHHPPRQQPFCTSMLMDLTDRALRYPRLAELIDRVARAAASPDEQDMFRAILVAVADHEEEGDDGGSSITTTGEPASALTVEEWREKWHKDRESFDRTVDAVRRAVGQVLLGQHSDLPGLDPDVKQEMWSSLVYAWEDRRRKNEEKAERENQKENENGNEHAQELHTSLSDSQRDDHSRLMRLVDDVAAGADPENGGGGTVKHLVVHEGAWPSKIAAFDVGSFYRSLEQYRRTSQLQAGGNWIGHHGHHQHDANGDDDYEWGNRLMYARVTTSTNTVLEQNPKLLATLPTGFTFTATRQLAGRGRGSNVWLSPEGQLIFSTVINHPHKFPAAARSGFSGSSDRPVVFIQYIAAIAVVEAIHNYAPGFEALHVKLKWPNDIYALDLSGSNGDRDPSNSNNYVKIGGILSSCSFSNGHFQVILGIGVNAVNKKPTTSLAALLPDALQARSGDHNNSNNNNTGPAEISIERLLASVLVRLEALYKQFCRDGFAGALERRYYRHWLHTNQLVTLEAVEGAPRARVLGVTPDWGLLQVAEVVSDGPGTAERQTGRVWKLQSDENSFDYWKGLVRTKT
ncbi:biotin apo-protein [Niveomyces insectorum RCEF 264]|uniref:Biotin apo-protein n=1 Tax=Niveomyces insectorum RCEF 264 TaxID=1081102 RepID=A0A167M1N7_9HYPO|nr:biotin apo-protein [Niveomyces insectorum RCEF 264]